MFALSISLTHDGLDMIKAELSRTLSNVKSSHRCEAIARSFGFRTYAALRAAIKDTDPVTVSSSGAVFRAYLVDHGFDVSPRPFYWAAARVAIRSALTRMPKLTMWGIGVGGPKRKSDGTWENWRDMNARFIAEREALLRDEAIEPFLVSLAFLSKVKPTKTIRRNTNSHWLKHIAENYTCTYPEGEILGPQYVANGVLIAAASHAGFSAKPYADDSGGNDLNACFNMSNRALRNLDSEIRPDGPYAQSRRWREERKNARRFTRGMFN